jgi:hypothetical protein|tara:strand:- start:632 stop:775 length:144 start_codon:yes stop_codon:yes gene_type:complete
MEVVYCKGCSKKISTIPFVGEPHHKLEDGVYCQACAKIIIDKRRRNL